MSRKLKTVLIGNTVTRTVALHSSSAYTCGFNFLPGCRFSLLWVFCLISPQKRDYKYKLLVCGVWLCMYVMHWRRVQGSPLSYTPGASLGRRSANTATFCWINPYGMCMDFYIYIYNVSHEFLLNPEISNPELLSVNTAIYL